MDMKEFVAIKKDFEQFLKDGNKNKIIKYSKEEISGTLHYFPPKQAENNQVYKAMEERKREIEREEAFLHLPDIFIGQKKILEKINILVEKAKTTNNPLPHMLLVGDEGMGKETLARIIAQQLNSNITISFGDCIEKAGDIIGILTNLNERDIFLIKDIEKLNKIVKDFLYPALHSYQIDFVIDKGPYAKQVKFNLKQFTLISTTSQLDKLDTNLARTFFSIYRFAPYSTEEISQLILNKSRLLNVVCDEESIKYISQKANGVPAEAVSLFNKVVKYAELSGVKLITNEVIQECLVLSESEYEADKKDIGRNIPGEVRREVWRRDEGKCVECGSQEKLEYDHVIPVTKGGSNTARNIRLLCEVCNRKKRDNI